MVVPNVENLKFGDIDVILENLNEVEDEIANSDLLQQKETKNVKKGKTCRGLQWLKMVIF